MKGTFCIVIFALVAPCVWAQTNLTELLQQGMFEEQVNHNRNTAVADYEALSAQFDKDRQLAATAIFRLGECYREEGLTNQAVMEYRRILREFPDQSTLVTLSQQDLTGMGVVSSAAGEASENSAALAAAANSSAEAAVLASQISGIESLSNTVEEARAVLAIFPENSADLAKVLMHLPKLQEQEAWAEVHPHVNYDEVVRTRGFAYPIGGPTYWPETELQKSNLLACARQELQSDLTYVQQQADFILGLQKARLKALRAAAGMQTAQQPNPRSNVWGKVKDLPEPELEQVLPMLVPDSILTSLLQQRDATERTLAQKGTFFSKFNPEFTAQQAVLSTVNQQISNRISAMMDALKIQYSAIAPSENAPPSEEDQEIARIQQMIKNSPDLINVWREGGQTPLISAVEKGQLKVAAYLLDHDANVNGRLGGTGDTPLIAAADAGQKGMVELLLSHGADINSRGGNGDTALHRAAFRGFEAVTKTLLAHHADVNAPGSNDGTPLMAAAIYDQAKIVQMLLAAGADPNIKDASGDTPLSGAAHVSPKIVKMLLAAGANPNSTDNLGRAPLSFAAQAGSSNALKILLSAKADPNAGTVDAPLLCAVGQQDTTSAELLLQAGANPNVKSVIRGHFKNFHTDGHYTPLWTAVCENQLPMVQMLLKYKADPNDSQTDNRPVIFSALDKPDIIQALLGAGADPNITNDNGRTLLSFAAEDDSPEAVSSLLAARADPNGGTWDPPLSCAIHVKDPVTVKLLLQAGANPNAGERSDWAPFDRPLIFNALSDANVLKALLDGGANPNLRLHGNTPFHLLSGDQYPARLEVDQDGNTTPLHWAAFHLADGQIFSLLLDHGADPNVRNDDGKTPLRILEDVASGDNLLSDLNIPDAEQRTLAASIVDLLHRRGAAEVPPDWEHITISRPSTKFLNPIFYQDTNDWNQFTLYDLLGVQYGLLSDDTSSGPYDKPLDLPFPDLSRIIIHRPPVHGTKWTDLKIDLADAIDSGNCPADVPLKFGDVVEIPETDHVLNEESTGLTTNQLVALAHCLTRHLQITINGMTTNITVGPQVEVFPIDDQESISAAQRAQTAQLAQSPGAVQVSFGGRSMINLAPQTFMLWPVLDDNQLLLSSSDLSHVTVKRRDAAAGRIHQWTLDCSKPDTAPYFWLRDGDEIEVPEMR